MANDRCPWCGAEATSRFGRVEYRCGSYPEEQSPICARVTRLEAALRNICDTHGPGTLAGDAAREALKP